jgi:proteasome lid subunit RPN8/RPN11
MAEKVIRLPRRFADEMIAHAREGAPQEVCGVLGGPDGRIEKLWRATNVAENPMVTYEMEPHEQWRVFQELEERGWEIVGLYHSHPASPAYPSATDVRLAFYPDSVYFIVSLADPEAPVIRAFRIDRETGEIEEREIIMED